MPSPSDRAGRKTLYGYTLSSKEVSALEIALLVRRMWRVLHDLDQIAVAHTTLLDDPAALVVDFTSPDAVTVRPGLCDQLLLISPRRGAMVIPTPRAQWEDILTRRPRCMTAAS